MRESVRPENIVNAISKKLYPILATGVFEFVVLD